MCQFALSYTTFIRILAFSTYPPHHRSRLASSFVHTRLRDTSFGLDSLETFAREGQAFMGALHVACQFVLSGKAVLPTEWAADDMAWEPLRVFAMNGRVVAFRVVFALGADSAAVIFAGVYQIPGFVTSMRTEMSFFMGFHVPDRNVNQGSRYCVMPSTAFNTAGYST